jgi:hypothetical protein
VREDQLLAEARLIIAEHGVMIQGSGGGDGSLPFAYTVGLTAVGHPELMLTGSLGFQTAAVILNGLASRVLRGGARFTAGDVPPEVLVGFDVMMAGPVPAARLPDYPPALAKRLYGAGRVRVLQVVYQDGGHRWPWDDGYNLATRQPIVAPFPAGGVN